jgi:hypothetical protein
MSDPSPKPALDSQPDTSTRGEDDRTPQGPNLVIAYGLLALALLIAIAFAALIVWPFYKAR